MQTAAEQHSRRGSSQATSLLPIGSLLGSTNGTLVNGRRTTEAELVDGSTVRIGNTTMTLRLADEPLAQPPSSGW
jgi:pSer/pThr/pTyr-binding forkhead associated (FHA) protein